ncbi:YqaA family protein [Paralimibaculum aggregatum]|uniref:YqaA family protein n=2 Tax=Paralimibaculum aggregatum TaxID=3036245 RepID=A0ABQ6LBS0_9RHOB|nr:YqaA family protein [Limibaculum sp. NKW23]
MAERRDALWLLAGVSFAESSVFPITPLVMLIPMVLARPDRAWLIAAVCTAASVAGGVAGYAIGALLFEEVGQPVLAFYGKEDAFGEAAEMFNENGFAAVLTAAFTPFPYKVITIASGVTGLALSTLVLASIVGRGAQFFLVAAILWKFGPPARAFIERRLGLVASVGAALLIGGFAAVKFLI